MGCAGLSSAPLCEHTWPYAHSGFGDRQEPCAQGPAWGRIRRRDPRPLRGAVVHPSHPVQSPCRPRALRTLPDLEEVSTLGLQHPPTWPAPHCTPGRVLAPRRLSRELDVGLCPPFEKRFSHGRFHEQRQRGPLASAAISPFTLSKPRMAWTTSKWTPERPSSHPLGRGVGGGGPGCG